MAVIEVKVYPYRENVAYGNILWPGKFPMRAGKFPSTHPCANGTALDTFRARSYWASCFPEGDGITWKPLNGQSDEQCIADIRECFAGWRVAWAPRCPTPPASGACSQMFSGPQSVSTHG